MIYIDELPVKDKMYYRVTFVKDEQIHEDFIYDDRSQAEEGAQKLSVKRSCEVISSLPKTKSKKA